MTNQKDFIVYTRQSLAQTNISLNFRSIRDPSGNDSTFRFYASHKNKISNEIENAGRYYFCP